MTKKQIIQLAKHSFTGNDINPATVSRITAKLKRQDLRFYVKTMQTLVQQSTLFVHSAIPLADETKQQLIAMFKNKKAEYLIDKQLIAGLKIIDNDILYDYSVEKIIDMYIKQLSHNTNEHIPKT